MAAVQTMEQKVCGGSTTASMTCPPGYTLTLGAVNGYKTLRYYIHAMEIAIFLMAINTKRPLPKNAKGTTIPNHTRLVIFLLYPTW